MVKVDESSIINRYMSYVKASGRSVKPEKGAENFQDIFELRLGKSGQSSNASGSLKDIVFDMLSKQGFTAEEIEKGGSELNIDEVARQRAAKMLEPGGAWSPDAVSGRIVDFAISAFGNNKDKIEDIGSAINRGFSEAEKVWGGTLPEITNKTHSSVFEKLDLWMKGEYPPEVTI